MSKEIKGQLFVQHLEGLSRRTIEKYQKVIHDFIKGKHGIYALYKKDKLIYVGLASDLRSRLNNHLRDRHTNTWDRFSIYLTKDASHMRELEALLIHIIKPSENRQKGNFKTSENLKPKLKQELRKYQTSEFKNIFCDEEVQTVQKTQRSTTTRAPILKGFFKYRKIIKYTYKNKDHMATVLNSGKIEYQGKEYNSPSSATVPIAGRTQNGWTCWKYKDENGEWQPLDNLRKKK
ncbi:MAG: GIY-YIG nuclease family protein [Candidatus Nanoarchaeia archaeon]